jgi:hypothetical protein
MEPSSNKEPFITVESYKYDENAKAIPWIVGFNSDEGLISSVAIRESLKESDESTINRNEKIAVHFGFDHLSAIEQMEIIDEIKKFYFNNGEISIKKFENVTNVSLNFPGKSS